MWLVCPLCATPKKLARLGHIQHYVKHVDDLHPLSEVSQRQRGQYIDRTIQLTLDR